MDNDKILKLTKRKFPVLDVSLDLGDVQSGKESGIREIDGCNVTIEYGFCVAIIRKIEQIQQE